MMPVQIVNRRKFDSNKSLTISITIKLGFDDQEKCLAQKNKQ